MVPLMLHLLYSPEIDTLKHATTSSIASQLKDDDDYNSCVEWAVAAASAGCNAEYDLNIEANFEPLAADGLKKSAAKATNDNVYKDDELFQDDTPRTMRRRTWSTIMSTVQGEGGVLFQVVAHRGLTLPE